MEPVILGSILLMVLLTLLGSGVWVALALLGVGLVGLGLFTASPAGPLMAIYAELASLTEAAGFDLIWFGIFIVLVVEMAQITPPVGFNLFVLQGLTSHDIFYIARAALPFFLLLMVAVVLIVMFPEIATYLPGRMARSS